MHIKGKQSRKSFVEKENVFYKVKIIFSRQFINKKKKNSFQIAFVITIQIFKRK